MIQFYSTIFYVRQKFSEIHIFRVGINVVGDLVHKIELDLCFYMHH